MAADNTPATLWRRVAGWCAAAAAAAAIGGAAHAAADDRSPLNYPLKQYALMLATALLGGLVSWYAKVKRGELRGWSLMQLIGELCTSAFAGLLCFWLCEFANTPQLVTVSLVGIAGHMGTRAIAGLESYAERRWGVAGSPRNESHRRKP